MHCEIIKQFLIVYSDSSVELHFCWSKVKNFVCHVDFVVMFSGGNKEIVAKVMRMSDKDRSEKLARDVSCYTLYCCKAL